MSVAYMQSIKERYQALGYEPYRWFHAEDAPAFAAFEKPLRQARIGMLSTSGAYMAGQVAYHYKDDTSLRAIPRGTAEVDMRFAHITENYLPGGRGDPNCIFPLKSLNKLAADGDVGEVADEVFSCMGGVYSQRRVRQEIIPELTRRFQAQNIDAALLVPM